MKMLFLPLLLLLGGVVCEDEIRITSANGLIQFANNVNSGTNYSGTMVFLDTDIDLSGKTLSPIGTGSKYFLGTFDGQGYAISNYITNSSSIHIGLFGYSNGATIRNVVMDSSCSIAGYTLTSGFVYVGGIVGYCKAGNNRCLLENNVNMANIAFSNSDGFLYLGGIAGYLSSTDKYGAIAKNCANYGNFAHSNTDGFLYVGGIAGYSYGRPTNNNRIQNCLNCGSLANNNAHSGFRYSGGIAGEAGYTHINSCVGLGEVASKYSDYTGAVVGYLQDSQVAHCYWDKSIEYGLYGKGSTPISYSTSFDTTTFELSESVTAGNYTGTSLLSALNALADRYYLRDYSHWALNRDGGVVSFTISSRDPSTTLTLRSQVILLPSLAGTGALWFDGWYTDASCTAELDDFDFSSTSTRSLYGKYSENSKSYTITFDSRGGTPTPEQVTAQYGAVVTLPNNTSRDNCTVGFWEDDYGDIVSWDFSVPACNLTLHAVWSCTRIASAADLVAFSKVVSNGADYSGTTVFLDSDILFAGNLSQQFVPINHFIGVFDGQGHTISNLVIDASYLGYIGLFGYSEGATIRNVVVDSTCSIANYYNYTYNLYIGGIIGYCYSESKPCVLENNVNMASITFGGNVSGYTIYTGGFVGYLYSRYGRYESYVKNCANYGSIAISGTSTYVYVGGIVGHMPRDYSKYILIQNSLNCGAIVFNGTVSYNLYIGGIVGQSSYAIIENSVSAGKINSIITNRTYIGSIVGYPAYELSMYNCFSSEVIKEVTYEYPGITNFDAATFELSESVTAGNYTGTSLLSALNALADRYYLRNYSHWALNRDGGAVSFTINGRTQASLTISTQVILLPSLVGTGALWFDGWYTDASCTAALDDFDFSSTSTRSLYGKYAENSKRYTITFDSRGGTPTPEQVTAQYGTVVALPNNTSRDNCTVGFWEDDCGDVASWNFSVPAHDLTLHAVWSCIRITSAADLIDFSKVVNNGAGYSGTTVFLDSDIDLSGSVFEPVGAGSRYFLGTFDGQGHTISNLVIDAFSEYVGLFGYSREATIRNVVMDSTCTVANYYAGKYESRCAGGIIGYCYSYSKPCIIEDDVNMASITFEKVLIEYSLYIGGIVGYVYSYSPSNYESFVKNCANYGSIAISGTLGYSYAYIGGITGYVQSYSPSDYESFVKNCANYGSVTISDSIRYVHTGGITGYVQSYSPSDYESFIKNCANYGSIAISGTLVYVYIGGTVGRSSISSSKYAPIQNSLNYGAIAFNGTVEYNLYIGGIVGQSSYTILENCVSAGKINLISPNRTYIGSVVGSSSTANITHCLWTSDVGYAEPSGTGTLIATNSSLAELNITTLKELNEYAENRNSSTWSRWLMLHMNGGNINNLGYEALAGLEKSLPIPVKEGYSFLFWCTDASCNEQYIPETAGTGSTVTDLYAHWTTNNYTIIFDGNGGTPSQGSKVVTYDDNYGDLPTAEMEGHAFLGWFTIDGIEITKDTKVATATNQTLYAHWTINNYTVTFDFSNGTVQSAVLPFNSTVQYPTAIGEREGYDFCGWDRNVTLMPAENITIRAVWNISNPSEYVEIVFTNVDLSEEDVKEIIQGYTNEEFTIEKFEVDKNTGEIIVIVKFAGEEKASEFIRSVDENKRTDANHIKSVVSASDYKDSFSSTTYPSLISLLL